MDGTNDRPEDVTADSDIDTSYPLLNTDSGITIDTPDYAQIRQDRMDRNRETMKALNPMIAKDIIPQDRACSGLHNNTNNDTRTREDRAATCIQRHYRGHLGRQQYINKLYEKFEKEEALRHMKMIDQLEEGELLVESHRLEVQFEDDITLRKNKARKREADIITIQRAWRHYRERQQARGEESESEASVSDIEITEIQDDHQMSVSSPEDNPTDTKSDFNNQPIKTLRDIECESVLSDYSEMGYPLKEVLAQNGGTYMRSSRESSTEKEAGKKLDASVLTRAPDETEDEFTRRLRKMNYLSLAQEFAELKKTDENALPFGLRQNAQDANTPTSESSMDESNSGSVTATCTPSEPNKDFPEKIANNTNNQPKIAWGETSANPNQKRNPFDEPTKEQPINTLQANPAFFERHDKDTQVIQDNTLQMNPAFFETLNQNTSNQSENDNDNLENTSTEKWATKVSQPQLEEPNTQNTSNIVDNENMNRKTTNKSVNEEIQSESQNKKNTGVADFDVYNIESTLPDMDWAALENQLKAAAEEEEQSKSNRRNEREEIRRKLAMGDEDYYGGERTLKKPNLSTRLQSGMNLQICFMNEAHEQSEAEAKSPNTAEPTQIQPVPAVPENTPPPKPPRLSPDVLADSLQIERKEGEEEEDFLARQAKLQADARMALAQIDPRDFATKLQEDVKMALAQAPAMAHMQLQVEKQAKKKSPIAEMVGIPGFGDGRRKKLERHLLLDMNIAQLQVVVNDLHTQIENLNEQLMRLLVERDDLHMEQDSKLVDIEDLTRRYQELNEKYNTQLQQQQQQQDVKTSKKKGSRKK